MTKYVVVTLPKPLAQNSVSAVRQVAEKKGSGAYVAVPKRSWQPQTVEVTQETKVSFGSDS